MSYTQPSPMESKIPATISSLEHRGSTFIKVDIPNTSEAKQKIRSIQGRKWSQTHHCWYIPNKQESIEELKQYFEVKTLKIQESEKKTETKSLLENQFREPTKQETIANQNRKIITGSSIRMEEDTKEWFKLFVPYDKKGWINIVRDIPGRKWNTEGKYWRVP